MKETKHTKYDKKRKRINLSITPSEQRKMKGKYGRILTGPEVKEIVMNDQVTIITKNTDPELPEVIRQLTKMGNNLNQLARLANQKKEVTGAIFIQLQITEIKAIISQLRNKR